MLSCNLFILIRYYYWKIVIRSRNFSFHRIWIFIEKKKNELELPVNRFVRPFTNFYVWALCKRFSGACRCFVHTMSSFPPTSFRTSSLIYVNDIFSFWGRTLDVSLRTVLEYILRILLTGLRLQNHPLFQVIVNGKKKKKKRRRAKKLIIKKCNIL